jgi:hypothetical protein
MGRAPHELPTGPQSEAGRALDARWVKAWGLSDPFYGHEPRDRAARFHSLPESRVPQTPADAEVAVDRHRSILAELVSSHPDQELVVLVEDYKPNDTAYNWHAQVFPTAWIWRANVAHDVEDPKPVFTYFADDSPHTIESLLPAFRGIAIEDFGHFVVTNRTFSWRYHPYYAGGDVIAVNAAERDRLRDKFSDWLPENEGEW